MTDETAKLRTLGEHRGIVEAMTRRDAEVAAARAIVHIAGLEDWLRRASPPGKQT